VLAYPDLTAHRGQPSKTEAGNPGRPRDAAAGARGELGGRLVRGQLSDVHRASREPQRPRCWSATSRALSPRIV